MAADQTFEHYRKPTRREEFLKTMQVIVPWAALCEVIRPYYPKAGNRRPPIGLERMLRIHFIQHCFNLADRSCEQALYDSASLRCFVGIDLGREPVPDATTILKFRELVHDKHPLPGLLHGNEQRVYGDCAYASQKKLMPCKKAPHAKDFTNHRTRRAGGIVGEVQRGKNRNKSRIRARVEHVFGAVKRLWGFGKVRYRGAAKECHAGVYGPGTGKHLPQQKAVDGTGASLRPSPGPLGPGEGLKAQKTELL